MTKFEQAIPNPEHLIKSISEQGYSFEAAIADLIDNSVSANANKVQIFTETENNPYKLFIADNGDGMSLDVLRRSMQFPSCSPEGDRAMNDLGRFGLGMKTASFSQSRKFTVISKAKGESEYHAFTWDVEVLKSGEWKIIVNTQEDISLMVEEFNQLSTSFLNTFDEFEANTIIVWNGLYKFEQYLEEKNKKIALHREINEVATDHLQIVFHRFMEKKKSPLKIRVNNHHLTPFNPFPTHQKNLRNIEYKSKRFGLDKIKIEGFVLPSSSISEAKEYTNVWTTKNRSLLDMEGVYIYRADRLIVLGGWNGLIKKSPRLQLARLRVDIGNNSDHLLHLNVAKSTVIIPHELKTAFQDYIDCLKAEAKKEFFNREIRRFPDKGMNNLKLFERKASNRDVLLEINENYPLLKALLREVSKSQSARLKIIFRMINTTVNKLRNVHEDNYYNESENTLQIEDLIENIEEFKNIGISNKMINTLLINELGYKYESLPEKVKTILKG
ncbi:ATP-binding protein [Pseudoalteromonas arctica]|uniref:ATP-binding protein n=1 Tax=Pseudoalteromonas arctica TaxID=394751 RepID=A0ABU9TIC4_9GAMM